MTWLLVALGGAIGALGRFALAGPLNAVLAFPIGTLCVNVLGGLAIGALVPAFAAPGSPVHAFLVIGILGGFTTFSAFSIETVALMQSGRLGTAAVYALASVVLSVGAALSGIALSRGLA